MTDIEKIVITAINLAKKFKLLCATRLMPMQKVCK